MKFLRSLLIASMCSSGLLACASRPSNEGLVYKASNWDELHRVFVQLDRKADGVVAGAFVDKISTLLDEQWDQLHSLVTLGRRDPAFLRFVVHSLDDAVPGDMARRIRTRASHACPEDARFVCAQIESQLSKLI
jgi:hypothetical protein